MPSKSFLVKVELEIQKVSCPGVWLCSNGKVSLQLYMLDSTIQTDSHKPFFPVSFKEKFIFYKTFLKERRLSELQRTLGREWICAEFIQWKSCEEGVILASFQTTLDDLLYPTRPIDRQSTEVDLLMEPTKLFPGTISPKLELRTRTTIQEITVPDQDLHRFEGNFRKRICPKHKRRPQVHPKWVCHSVAYSKAQQRCPKGCKGDKRPAFKYKRAEDDLILRLNPNKVSKDDVVRADVGEKRNKEERCYCRDISQEVDETEDDNPEISIGKSAKSRPYGCVCEKQHTPQLCPICSKYEGTFAKVSSFKPPSKPKKFLSAVELLNSEKYYCSYCRNTYVIRRCPCKDMEVPSQKKKVCLCVPEESRAGNLVSKLHEKVMNTVQAGRIRIDDCIGDCEVTE
ncbi:uncharacterized protein [Euwallacea similis]|uniref:uncharacterized protein n=1 Tax=Euwallacea similis TaxID=1736056 RepID=UPI00344F8658